MHSALRFCIIKGFLFSYFLLAGLYFIAKTSLNYEALIMPWIKSYNSTFLGNEKKLIWHRSSYKINNDSGTRSHKPTPVNEIKWFWGKLVLHQLQQLGVLFPIDL
jgi:hypothetical protein